MTEQHRDDKTAKTAPANAGEGEDPRGSVKKAGLGGALINSRYSTIIAALVGIAMYMAIELVTRNNVAEYDIMLWGGAVIICAAIASTVFFLTKKGKSILKPRLNIMLQLALWATGIGLVGGGLAFKYRSLVICAVTAVLLLIIGIFAYRLRKR